MIRLAEPRDAAALCALNDHFNGPGSGWGAADMEKVLARNPQEVVVVAQVDGELAGFVCIQLKRSFCCREAGAEVTEVFVEKAYRRRGLARAMLAFAEAHCKRNHGVRSLALLTGRDNAPARSLYQGLGYQEDGEVHLVKEQEDAE